MVVTTQPRIATPTPTTEPTTEPTTTSPQKRVYVLQNFVVPPKQQKICPELKSGKCECQF